MFRHLVTLINFYRLNLRLDLKSLIAYPTTFWLATLTIPFWSLIQILLIETIYGQVDNFLGYSRYENYALFGTYKLVQSLATVFFMVQLGDLADRIRGDDNLSLDMMLLKPIDSQIFATTGRFWFGSISSVLVALAMIGYGFVNEPRAISVFAVVTYVGAMVLGVIMFYLLYLFIQTWLFWSEYLQIGHELWFTIQDVSQYPRHFYQGGAGVLMNIVVPLTLSAAIPVEFLFGHMPWFYLVLYGGIVFCLTYVMRRFWQYSIKKYSSFSS